MSWARLLEIIEDECGATMAARIEDRARIEMGGVRLTVSARKRVTAQQVEAASPGRPKDAAKALNIHPSTAYRALTKTRTLIR